MTKKQIILFRVNAGQGFGFGHLNRCITLFKLLQTEFDVQFALKGDSKAESLLKSYNINYTTVKTPDQFIQLATQLQPDLIVTDFRDSASKFIISIRQIAKVISIDDLGEGCHYASYTVNSLPQPSDSNIRANFEGLDYLILNQKLASYKSSLTKSSEPVSLLISFGGEDPYQLTEFCISILKELELNWIIKIVVGPLFDRAFDPLDFEVFRSPDDFFQLLCESDLIISSFGLTVFEALSLGVPVLTLNPTPYHDNLAEQISEITNLGVGVSENRDKILAELRINLNLERVTQLKTLLTANNIDYLNGAKRMTELIHKVIDTADEKCPVCSSPGYVFKRVDWLNELYCYTCKTYFKGSNYDYQEAYSDDYFTTQYNTQYGKTYLEDKDQINRFNKGRLDTIANFVPKNKSLDLLEIGSAMGFFLELAKDQGFNVSGVEISGYASSYAKTHLGLDVFSQGFEDYPVQENSFDVIASWFFIEHQKDFITTLRKIKQLLKPGGLIALSTPNGSGISFVQDKLAYINTIPKDHFVEFSPKSLSLLLKSEGFTLEKLIIKGTHVNRLIKAVENRYPIIAKVINRSFLHPVLSKLMIWFKLGDTFEVYARHL